MTREERSFVDSVLLAEDGCQDAPGFGGEAAAGVEPQRTVKINQLSFNENSKQVSTPPPCFKESALDALCVLAKPRS